MNNNISVRIQVRVKYESLVFAIAKMMTYLKLWDMQKSGRWVRSFMEYNIANKGWEKLYTGELMELPEETSGNEE